MDYCLSPIEEGDGPACLAIFNHYITNGSAAFFDHPLPQHAAGLLLAAFKGYPSAAVRDDQGRLVGFGFLRAYNEIPTFSRTAELSYFISPEITGMGIGTRLLSHLETGARDRGVRTLIASIASENTGSVRFHEKNGFVRCGTLIGVYERHGEPRNVIVMQKLL